MLSKLLASHYGRVGWRRLSLGSGLPVGPPPVPSQVVHKPKNQLILARYSGHYVPPSQYDIPINQNKFNPLKAMVIYWELIPIFVTTSISIFILVVAIAWASKNKVDVVFSTHSCANISRTMNLRRPTVHKMLIINQRYEPWPEMQDVLDKMTVAEHRVDVVYETHSRECISRTMDLRNPSFHKMVRINQRTDPWPEMAKPLELMIAAEKRAKSRLKDCFPR